VPAGVQFDPSLLAPEEASRRRHGIITLVLLLAGPAVLTMADLHWRTGFDPWRIVHLALFTLLFILIALGAAQSLVGYSLRRKGGDRCSIGNTLDEVASDKEVSGRTAVVMPICNEDVARVMEGVRVIFESLERTRKMQDCDFFILSDSTDPNCWIAEEAAWLALTRELHAQGRIFYRKRRLGINKKSGNLADFCRRWGKLYRYMVVLDADSIMTGDAILRLIRLMERNPRVGIIQGVPLLTNGETVLARIQQFASRLYGPVSAAGLNYWQLGEANYWGHNAIIRLAPFIKHCSLPELPGEGPFGGRILSHDYVEAALMRRAGWQVWLVTDLEGNYEECPPTVIDLAERDRRWLQGNLQHTRLIAAKGFHPVNRIHFLLGILAYLASPLWLAFLVISVVIADRLRFSDQGSLPLAGFAAYAHWSYTGEALSLFAYTITLLFLPKVLSLLDLRSRPAEVAAFGGWDGLWASVLLETLIFTLLAPVLMLFHTWFILLTLLGQKVSWGAQRRGAGADSALAEATMANSAHTVLGVLGAMIAYNIDPYLALWMSPILAGLILSIPLSYFTGSLPAGLAFRRNGIFETPEESRPFPELVELVAATEARRDAPLPPQRLRSNYGLLQAILDPYVNAVHVSLLRAKDDPSPATEERFVALRATLLREGPDALEARDRKALLMDAESMHLLHYEVWSTPGRLLASWWQSALQYYTRLAPAPRTAFSR
jgi:membrane glycosyltransferase